MKQILDYTKGLRLYVIIILVVLSFFAYSQNVGWRWIGATNTEPPAGEQQHGYRHFYHK